MAELVPPFALSQILSYYLEFALTHLYNSKVSFHGTKEN